MEYKNNIRLNRTLLRIYIFIYLQSFYFVLYHAVLQSEAFCATSEKVAARTGLRRKQIFSSEDYDLVH